MRCTKLSNSNERNRQTKSFFVFVVTKISSTKRNPAPTRLTEGTTHTHIRLTEGATHTPTRLTEGTTHTPTRLTEGTTHTPTHLTEGAGVARSAHTPTRLTEGAGVARSAHTCVVVRSVYTGGAVEARLSRALIHI